MMSHSKNIYNLLFSIKLSIMKQYLLSYSPAVVFMENVDIFYYEKEFYNY